MSMLYIYVCVCVGCDVVFCVQCLVVYVGVGFDLLLCLDMEFVC